LQTLIVDDHLLFSEGLRHLLTAASSSQTITCCQTGADAVRLAAATPFDLILLDWNLGAGLAGAPLIAELKLALPSTRVVVVSGESSTSLIRLAIESGAVGFVPKESSPALLIDALTVTTHGGIYLPVSVLEISAHEAMQPIPASPASAAEAGLRSIGDAFPQLTPRHGDVLSQLVRGLSNKQIARRLDISEGTVKQHLNAIFRELGVESRTEAVYLLSKQGVRFD